MGDDRRSPHGSVLMLVPAAVLVLFVLGSIAVDHAIAFMAQRELTSAAAAAANDAATAALSDQAFYGGSGDDPGTIEIDDDAAARFAERAIAARAPRGVRDVVISRVHAPGHQVCVIITGRVDYIFARAIPGGPRGTTVTGRAVATAVSGDDDAVVPRGDPASVC